MKRHPVPLVGVPLVVLALGALLGQGRAALAAPAYVSRLALPVPGPAHAVAADLDGDGHLDLAAVSAVADRLYVYYGRGDASFRFPPDVYPTDRNPAFVAAGDLSDD